MKEYPLKKTSAPNHGVKLLTLASTMASLLCAPAAWSSSPVLRADSYATIAPTPTTFVNGTATTILVDVNNTGFIQYGLGLSLPDGVSGLDIDKATLKVYISTVVTSGALTIRKVTST